MPTSKKLVVLKRLTALLETISIDTGFSFDMANSVFRGIAVFGDETALPAISILDNLRPDAGLFAGENLEDRSEDWNLLLQGWVKDDKKNPTDPAYNLMADVEKKLSQVVAIDPQSGMAAYPDDYMLDGLIAGMQIGPGIARPPQADISTRAFFFLPLKVTLAYDVANPYAEE